MSKLNLVLVMFLVSCSVLAENHMLILGAGGKPKEIFYQTFETLTTKINDLNFQKKIIYNGGDKTLEPLTNAIVTKEKKDHFTKTAFENYLITTLDNIRNGKIKKGEKLLIYLDSHGALRDKETSHIVIDNNNNDINLDILEEIFKASKIHGVNLALLDFSCHSGASLDLQKFNQDACIISGTSENNFAYSKFSHNFTSLMTPGKNLEEIFLKARKGSAEADLPQINTPEGLAVRKKMIEIDRLFYNNENDPTDPGSRKLTDYINSVIENNSPTCSIKNSFNEHFQAISKLVSAYDKMGRADRSFLLNSFLSKIKEKKDIINRLIGYNRDLRQFREKIFKIQSQGEMIELTYEDIASIDTQEERTNYQDKLSRTDLSAIVRKEYEIELAYLNELDKAKKSLKNEPSYQKISALVQKQKEDNKKFDFLTTGMAREERIYYDELYKQESKIQKSACQQFVL